MRVLILGRNGFIGSAVAARLQRDGVEVVGVTRPTDRRPARAPSATPDRGVGGTPEAPAAAIGVDVARMVRPEDWAPVLEGIDAVVNAVGVLQDSVRDSTTGAHRDGPAALFEACCRAGIRRVIQISAVGVDDPRTSFSGSKAEGDAALTRLDLEWLVLRPSIVLGSGAVGGSALLRGLAALPLLPVMPDTGPMQPVMLDDVVETVARALASGAPSRQVLELVGPERYSMTELVARYRAWLGARPARTVLVPRPVAGLAYRLGDAVGLLGWRPPMRTNARIEIRRGAVGDPEPWMRATGIAPRSLAASLAADPATVQDRWFAGLYFLVPLALAAFALLWIGTGLVSLGPGYAAGLALLAGTAAQPFAGLVVVAGGVADLAVGLAVAYRPTVRLGLLSALAITFAYLAAGSLLVPGLWIDPLGPLLKAVPILALNLILLAVTGRR